LADGKSLTLNLGTGHGTTVKELLAAVQSVSGRNFTIEYGERREGDSPALVADNALAKQTIGWSPHHDLESIIKTAWNWHTRDTA
jgi:UDP-glucose 4-epimerase